MKILVRIKIRSRMNSVVSETESIAPLSDTVTEMIPLIDDISKTMGNLSEKIKNPDLGWIYRPISPKAEQMKMLMAEHALPEISTVYSLLTAIFDQAKAHDIETRTIHFSDASAIILGKPVINLFDFLKLVIDSVVFC